MKQYEVVQQAMAQSGGYATLGALYQTVPKEPDWRSASKTPFAGIRRIVQDERFFFRIRPGLWGLNERKETLAVELSLPGYAPKAQVEEFDHSYYQGLLVELGNFKKYQTSIDYHDKGKLYAHKKLSEVATLSDCYEFTYEHVLRKVRTVDVTWFNARQFPFAFFEIEHTTGIYNSLLKFLELQDFRIRFYIVADEVRHAEYDDKIANAAFAPIRNEVRFFDYEAVSKQHSLEAELVALSQVL